MSMGNFENLHSLEDSEVITTMQDQIMLGISLLLSKYAAPNELIQEPTMNVSPKHLNLGD